jgi:hypothetical protein
MSWYVYQWPLQKHLICYSKYCRADNHCSIQHLRTTFIRATRRDLTSRVDESLLRKNLKHLVSNLWLSFPSSKLWRNFIRLFIFFDDKQNQSIFFRIQFLHACLIRLCLLLAFYLPAWIRWLGFYSASQSYAHVLPINRLFFWCMSITGSLSWHLSPLASSAVKLPHHSRSIWLRYSTENTTILEYPWQIGAISVLWVIRTFTQAWKLLNTYSVYLLGFYHMSSEGAELENFRPTKTACEICGY